MRSTTSRECNVEWQPFFYLKGIRNVILDGFLDDTPQMQSCSEESSEQEKHTKIELIEMIENSLACHLMFIFRLNHTGFTN